MGGRQDHNLFPVQSESTRVGRGCQVGAVFVSARPLPESWARAMEQGLPNSGFLMGGVSSSTSARARRQRAPWHAPGVQPPHHGTGQGRVESGSGGEQMDPSVYRKFLTGPFPAPVKGCPGMSAWPGCPLHKVAETLCSPGGNGGSCGVAGKWLVLSTHSLVV